MSISVGIPFYNADKFLENAIKSVLNQTYQDFELILLNDGSTDGSLEIAKKYEKIDSRIRVINDGQNKRLPTRLNELIAESKFDLIARMDADDIMHPQRLEKQFNVLNDSNYDLVSTSYFTIDSSDNVISTRIIKKDKLCLDNFLLGNYYILHPSILARRSWYLNHLYDPNFDRAEDYELWIRSLINYTLNIKIIDEPLMYYREDGSISKNKQILSYKKTNLIFDKYFNELGFLSFIKSKVRNNLKIFILSFFYSKKMESFLLKRRDKFSKGNLDIEKSQRLLNSIISF